MNDANKTLGAALAAPFDPSEIKFLPKMVKGNRALALAYVDARTVMDRLDEVLGVECWQDEYTILPDNSVMCRLRVRFGKGWIVRTDVGSPSEQPDGGDRLKAAFSDALKRAAVKFGVGRYLYRLKAQWCDYDPVKKCFTQLPNLGPVAEMPKPAPKPQPKPAPTAPQPKPKPAPVAATLPATGEELARRLREKDTLLTSEGRCQMGALIRHVSEAEVREGYGEDIRNWSVELAIAETKRFTAQLPAPKQHAA